ncbi:MAG: MaoC family dehydratase [Actinomycetota bacterium]
MASSGWPQPLQPVTGPMRPAKIDGAARGMGDRGPATRSMVEAGLVPPDLLCGLTLFLLANQPRPARPPGATGSERKGAAGVSGGVWVRERFTVHRPLPTAEVFLVEGEAVGRHVRKGRRYGTTVSRTVDAAHRPVASNVTTGLLSYRPEAGLADGVDGQPADEVEVRGPDHGAAAENPHLDVLLAVRLGDTFGGDELVVSLAMMAARDTDNPDNPIHSDLEEAKRAGLAKPIAGGSHVLSFAIEPLLAAWGPGALSHGAAFDVRWKAPTEADDAIVPTATVTSVDDGVIVVTVEVALAAGPVAMTGTVAVPVPTS